MTQFQVKKDRLSGHQLVATSLDAATLADGEVLLKIERFGFSANNVTYGAAGDTLGYWHFFPPVDSAPKDWGVLPVWGFADVIASRHSDIPEGERLFGYFPPATHVVMQPTNITERGLVDGSAHRAALPPGYNMYQRVAAEPNYDRANDNTRCLLYPLYITSWLLGHFLQENGYFDAEQVLIISASSKTSIGLAYALKDQENPPKVVGITSSGNKAFVEKLGLYDQIVTYDDPAIENSPSAIVDMAGNSEFLGSLHATLGENMRKSINVGLTHWEEFGQSKDVIGARTEFFFAPSQIQKLMKDWGAGEFYQRSGTFIATTAARSSAWLNVVEHEGLAALPTTFEAMRDGRAKADEGIIFRLG